MAKVQTLTEMRAMLDAAGLKPLRRFGQNFFIDGNLLRRLVDAAEIQAGDTVVEVGGGTGVLTDLLAERCGQLLVVEIDRNLSEMLSSRFEQAAHVKIHCGDALHGKHHLCDFLMDELSSRCRDEPGRGRLLLVANLPYHVATPLLINLLIAAPRMTRFCFTVQKEMAERIAATSKTKAYGPVSIVVQALCEVHLIARVPPQSFWPRPTVDSQMLRLDRKTDALVSADAVGEFAEFVRKGFLHRRKLLAYNLSSAGFKVSEPWASTKVRAEDLTVGEWVRLFYGRQAKASR